MAPFTTISSILTNPFLFTTPFSTHPKFTPFPAHHTLKRTKLIATAMDRGSGEGDLKKMNNNNSAVNTNYVVPFDKYNSSSIFTRPLFEILRDLNKKIPDTNIDSEDSTRIPWYHANRMLSFYAPGWCGEIRDVIFADNGFVTVVFRVTIRGSDGEAHRESTGTVSSSDTSVEDPVAAAEEIAFCRACARFGLGLYLYQK